MANNKQTYTIELDADIKGLLSHLETAKNKMAGLLDDKQSKNLAKAFEMIQNQLGKISDKTSKPMDLSGFRSAQKELDKVKEVIHSITRLTGDFASLADSVKIQFLPDDEKKKVEEATKAMEKYLALVATANAKSKDLESAKKTKDKAEAKLLRAEQGIGEITDKRSLKRAKLEGIQGKLAAEQNSESANPKKVAEYQAAIGTLQVELEKLDKDLEAANNGLEASKVAFTEAERVVQGLTGEIKKLETDQLSELKKEAKDLGISLDGIKGKRVATQIELLTEAIEKQRQEMLSHGETGFNKYKEGLDSAGEAAEGMSNKLQQGEQALQKIDEAAKQREAFETRIKQFLGLAGAAKILGSALRNAFADIKELDAVMTEIAVVTDFKVGDMWEQLPEYTSRANELGIAISEAYKASALFYQQGLDTNEMVELSNETLKMARIAGLDASEATDRMTAALRGFNMELNQASAQKVADVYSQLAAITASDVDEISSAMTKTASIASSAGMEFETTAAFLSQIIETTRESAETAGTAMKTVIARFQELKKDPSEIGEVEGEIVDANAIETALRSVGVSLRDAGGQFRELDDVFLELSSKWDGLDKNTQRYIATIAAGSRQQSRFIAMMQDYGRTQELVAAANTSAGASQKQYEKTLDSLETKLAKLDNAWTEFSTGLMNSDFVKFAVDFLTNLLNTLNKVTKGFGGITGSLSKIGTLTAIFQTTKVIVDKFFQDIVNKVYTSAKSAGENIAQGVQDGIASQQNKNQESNRLGRMTGYAQMKEGFSKLEEAKHMKEVESPKKLKQYNKALTKRNQLIQQGKTNTVEYENTVVEIQNLESQRAQDIENLDQKTKEAWNSIYDGAQTAAQGVTLFGTGLGLVGQIFNNMGLEEVGEVFSEIGKWVTLLGSSMMALIPILKILGVQFTKEGIKIAVAGFTASLGWLWVVAIIAAVALLTIGIIHLIKNSDKAAKNLDKANEAAEGAAKAADEAAESYNNLVDAFDKLDGKYKALEELTKGTKEWNQAVQDINSSVLDLIDEYPELAKFVTNKDGVLSIDLDSTEVQNVLNEAAAKMVVTKNASISANMAVTQAEADLARDRLGIDLDDSTVDKIATALGSGALLYNKATGQLNSTLTTEELKKQYGLDSNQLSVYSKEIGNNIDALKEFGNQLVANNAQIEASYEAMATAIEGNVTLMGLTAEQEQRAKNLVDGETYQLLEDKVVSGLDALDMTKKNVQDSMTADQREAFEAALETVYGEGAIYDGTKREVTYTGEDGATKTEKLSEKETEIKEQMKSYLTSEAYTNALKVAATAQNAAGGTIGSTAIANLYKTGEGKALTKEDVNTIQSALGEGFADDWSKLTDDEKQAQGKNKANFSQDIQNAWDDIVKSGGAAAYGDDITQFVDDLVEGVTIATEAFNDAANTLEDEFEFLTSEAATGFADKINGLTSGNQGKVKDATSALLEGIKDQEDNITRTFTDEEKQSIVARVNATDWTNQEALLKLQYDLEKQYGFTEKQARTYIDTLGDAAYATSHLSVTNDIFGDFYKATQKVNAAMQKTADLQWEYERLLNNGASALELQNNLEEQRNSIYNQGKEALGAYDEALKRQAEIYVDGKTAVAGVDLTEYVTFNEETRQYDVGRLQEIIESLDPESKEGKAATDWMNSLIEASDLSNDQLEIAKDSYEQLEELNEQFEASYYKLWHQISEAFLAEQQKAIDIQKDILDATENANEKLVSKIQEQIDADRQARENEKAEEDIANLRSQAAYLGMDTSGANALAILDLEKQIAEAEQSYEDSLIDQSLQELEDANQKAAEQRERQIAIAEQQLEIEKNSPEHQRDVTAYLDDFLTKFEGEETEEKKQQVIMDYLGGLFKDAGLLGGMNPKEQKSFWQQVAENTANAANYLTGDNGDAVALLNQIQSNTSMDAYYDMKTQQEVITAGGIAQSQLSPILGFTPRQIVDKDKEGNVKTGKTTSEYLTNITSLATTYAPGSDATTAITTARTSAETKYKAIEMVAPGIYSSEADYYDSLTNDQMNQLTKDIINGGTSDLSWSSYIDTAFSSVASQWLSSETEQGFQSELTSIVDKYHRDGFEGIIENMTSNGLSTLISKYAALTSQDEGAAKDAVATEIKKLTSNWTYGSIDSDGDDGFYKNENNWNNADKDGTKDILGRTRSIPTTGDMKWKLDGQEYTVEWRFSGTKDKDSFKNFLGEDPGDKWVVMSDSNLWAYNAKMQKWLPLKQDSGDGAAFYTAYSTKLKSGRNGYQYKTGGLADFTGPAWLDGTPSRPEYILNADQTERFFSLIDVLESFDKTSNESQKQGDNYFEIEINVEKLENDYDIEKVADKIRSMIYEDATYRNVNAINHIR